MARNEDLSINVKAKDDASKVLDKLADTVGDLEKLDPVVEVTADTSKAEADVEDLADDVEDLADEDVEVVVTATVDDARGDLARLQADMVDTRLEAERTVDELDKIDGGGGGSSVRANAISDLTGPLGEASGAASDFGEAFEGLDEIIGGAVSKLGGSQQLVGQISTALGGLGVAVAAGAAAWSLFSARQRKAEADAAKLTDAIRDTQDALREGDWETAARNLTTTFAEAYREAEQVGISIEDLTGYIIGASDSFPMLKSEFLDLGSTVAALEVVPAALKDGQANLLWQSLVKEVDGARNAWREGNLTIDEQNRALDAAAGALRDTTTATDAAARSQDSLRAEVDKTRDAIDRIRGALDIEQATLNFNSAIMTALDVSDGTAATEEELLGVKQSILDLGETARTNPAVIQAQIDEVTPENLMQVAGNVNTYYARNPVPIATELQPPTRRPWWNTGSGGGGAQPMSMPIETAGVGTRAVGTATPTAAGGAIVVSVPAPKVPTPHVTIQAGVIGNRFDVERTVAHALRRYERRNGRRRL